MVETARETLRRFAGRVSESLPDIEAMTGAQVAVVWQTYGCLVRPNFIPWLARGGSDCRSEAAMAAFRQNLLAEVVEDHQGMLARLTSQCEVGRFGNPVRDAIYRATGEQAQAYVVKPITDLVFSSRSSLDACWIMGGLETASQEFIPWLDRAADRLGVKDKEYILKHGIADEAHANEFAKAIAGEAEHMGVWLYPAQDPLGVYPLSLAFSFLKHIFSSGNYTPPDTGR